MAKLVERVTKPADFFGLSDDWWTDFPMWGPALFRRNWVPDEVIRVDEYRENGSLVIRAELPGIDPVRDVELTVVEGVLRIEAQRREEEKVEERGYLRHELRRGMFTRELPLPEGVSEAEIAATYADGVLEIRVPAPGPAPAKKVTIKTD